MPGPTTLSYQSVDANRFAERYRKMSDDELLRLARQQADLLPEAVEALRVELGHRNLASTQAKVAEQHLLCSLCKSDVGFGKKTLYEKPVCSSCSRGFWQRRAIAHVIDDFVLAGLIPLALVILLTVTAVRADWFELFFLVAFLPYLFRDSYGLSIGKLITGLEVIDVRTRKPAGFMASLKRNSSLYIPFIPIVIALQMSKGPRFGDVWAHTRVILRKYRDELIGDLQE